MEHIVDLNAEPFIPDGWKVKQHQEGGQFTWDSTKVSLSLSKKPKRSTASSGFYLRKEPKGKSVFNANLLDYLLANPHLIPGEWKDKEVFFWGTIYDVPNGIGWGDVCCVRSLGWFDDQWRWNAYGLHADGWRDWKGNHFVVITTN